MAQNFTKNSFGSSYKPQTSTPTTPVNGDLYYDSTRKTFVSYMNGVWVDEQSRTDVASATSLTSTTVTATVTQSSVIRITGSTASTLFGMAAAADAKSLILYNETTALLTIANNSVTEPTAANRILCPNGASLSVSAGQSVLFIYDGAQALWVVANAPSSGSGSGGGSKNYLSAYTASTSSNTQNAGNGNFESGSTSGWSLGTIGTLTNGLPTGSPTFGSGASGNLSLGVVSSGQLAGLYSGSLVSSAATTQGNMMASNAFFIDAEDQAKVLTVKFYYEIAVGAGVSNFSGSSSNSYAWAAYDVTNSNWLSSAGTFNLTQNSGIGYCTGTFQTAINTTQIRFIIYNANATTGAATLYVDDISVGPQTAPSGPVMTDWVAYTPVFTGFGTVSASSFQSRRVGKNLEIMGEFVSGTSTATAALITMGYNGVSGNVTADASVISSSESVVGSGYIGISGALGLAPIAVQGATTLNFGLAASGSVGFGNALGNAIISSGQALSFFASVPITGWSSNSVQSSDTDTRVCAMQAQQSAPTATILSSFSLLKFTSGAQQDTHGGFSGSTGQYACFLTGFYRVTTSALVGATYANTQTSAVGVGHNSLTVPTISASQSAGAAEGFLQPTVTGTIFCNAGDFLAPLIASTAGTPVITSSATDNYFHVERLTGPAVISATESVNGLFTDTSSGTIGTSLATYTYGTKVKDSHNAYSGGTLTIPVSGMYHFSATLLTAGVSLSPGGAVLVGIFRNGTQIGSGYFQTPSSSSAIGFFVSANVDYPCLAGDAITVKADSTVGTVANSAAGYNNFSWVRVGN